MKVAVIMGSKSDLPVLFGAIGDPKYDNNPNAKVRPSRMSIH